MASKPAPAPRDLGAISALENSILFPHFTAEDAFNIGTLIRNRIRSFSDAPAVVNITLTNSNQLLFHAASHPGTLPDNDIWVARKRKTVTRWGVSSWFMHNKLAGNEAAFAQKYALGETAGEYAIHGGGVPVRVKGVEGVVAVIVVSGLAQEDDHMVVVEGMQEYVQGLNSS